MRKWAMAIFPVLTLGGHLLYEDAPPPAHTGGFGEPSCTACHFDGPVNDGAGTLTLGELPDGYVPNEEYALRVRLAREGLARGGFQLSIRDTAGRQAGTLVAGEGADTTGSGGVVYAHHIRSGIDSAAGDSIDWIVRWRAPADPRPVVLNVAANAADGDASAFGDHIYTAEYRLEARH